MTGRLKAAAPIAIVLIVACAITLLLARARDGQDASVVSLPRSTSIGVMIAAGHDDDPPYKWASCPVLVLEEGLVATAAHCVRQGKLSPTVIAEGVSDLCKPLSGEYHTFTVSHLVVWDPLADLALLGAEDVSHYVDVRFIQEGDSVVPGTVLQAWGYGAASSDGPRQCELAHGRQVVVDSQRCTAAGITLGDKLCVENRDEAGASKVCTGFSGGPVLAIDPSGDRRMIGLTSSGIGCDAGALGTVIPYPDAVNVALAGLSQPPI